ncbi:MAG: DUF4446 family protein [Acidobacteria bacterium]|nr:DUF4446 family protein [Acidobacteriota bacterium]
MSLSPDSTSALALVGVGLAVVAVAVAAMLALRFARLQRAYAVLQGGSGHEDFVTAVGRHVEAARTLEEQVDGLRGATESLARALDRAVQRVGLVRFDAFEDMGGHLSFSAALLDGKGDGLVLTTISGRSDSRFYAKPVEGGVSRYNLSEEEREAIRRALAAPRG